MPNESKYSEEIQRLLIQTVDYFEREDYSVRERQIRQWRRLKLMWESEAHIYYDEVAHDWRTWDSQQLFGENDQNYYNKPINVYRAYLESIIAALSVLVPPIKCYPDDADNPLDITTARAGDKIAALIFRHNNAQLIWLNVLFKFCTEGLVGFYSYPKSDEKYGTIKKEKYEEVEELHEISTCPTCGTQIEDNIVDQFTDAVKDEFAPDNDDVVLQDIVQSGGKVCPQCEMLVDPKLARETLIVPKLVGITTEPKTRICIEPYGGLYLKTPIYAMKQADMPYLIWSYETNRVNILERFPHLWDKIGEKKNPAASSTGVYDEYARWGRLSPQYRGDYPEDVMTMRNAWLRPEAFNIHSKEDADELKKLFPNGAKVVLANDLFADAENECLDDCWTLLHNPLSDYLQFDPLGTLLTSVQEITNDLISLTLQTIEHGIPQTFADPKVVNFKAYRENEVRPGDIFPAIAGSGKSVADGFYQVSTATLSKEVLPFGQQIQTLGQMVSGALPSLFGGAMSESKTASEYSMSRAQAQQRLQNTWKMLTSAWKEVFGKVIPIYIKEMQDDEREVIRNPDGGFINTFIKLGELQGKIGKIELEANENLPITWNQQKDTIMQLLMSGNPEILATLAAPENLPLIREATGLTDFFVPGEADRDKQNEEIKLLLASEPIIVPPSLDPATPPEMMVGNPQMAAMMQPQELPSVPIEPLIDNNQIEFDVCRNWLISEEGRLAKITNPNGYKNVLLHALAHKNEAMMQQAQMASQEGSGVPGEKPKENTKTPIKEESDVNVNV